MSAAQIVEVLLEVNLVTVLYQITVLLLSLGRPDDPPSELGVALVQADDRHGGLLDHPPVLVLGRGSGDLNALGHADNVVDLARTLIIDLGASILQIPRSVLLEELPLVPMKGALRALLLVDHLLKALVDGRWNLCVGYVAPVLLNYGEVNALGSLPGEEASRLPTRLAVASDNHHPDELAVYQRRVRQLVVKIDHPESYFVTRVHTFHRATLDTPEPVFLHTEPTVVSGLKSILHSVEHSRLWVIAEVFYEVIA